MIRKKVKLPSADEKHTMKHIYMFEVWWWGVEKKIKRFIKRIFH